MTKTQWENITNFMSAVPKFIGVPVNRYRVDYDEEADVLYLSFYRPQKATDSEMLDNGIIVRKRGERIVGLTILDASTRSGPPRGQGMKVNRTRLSRVRAIRLKRGIRKKH